MQDVQLRKPKHQLEFLWRGTKSYSNWADIWSYAFGTGVSQWPNLIIRLADRDASRMSSVAEGAKYSSR